MHGWHLAYCTNIHRGENWQQTFDTLKRYTLAVRAKVSPGRRYAIGLRLGDQASRELSDPAALADFRSWLDRNDCYVFTINGFPHGQFHGTRVKEDVYRPDWTTPERLEYTKRLFDLLSVLVPDGLEGSVSTVPASYKEFISNEGQVQAMRDRLWDCVEHIAELSERTGKDLHLGLEPEPLCYLETSEETVRFIEGMRSHRPGDERINRHLGVNYDACHLACEYEEPTGVIRRFVDHGVRISKIHLSSALRVHPTREVREALRAFADPVYFHQVLARSGNGPIERIKDLDIALDAHAETPGVPAEEWRIHFHVPLHSQAGDLFGNTADHLLGLLDELRRQPNLCRHFEMETYTWEVMPSDMKNRDVVTQLVHEYEWTLGQLEARGLR